MVPADVNNHGQLEATVTELETMADLIQRYPAEAQLIIAAVEDGLTLGPVQPMDPQ
jgi:hypothetical protein